MLKLLIIAVALSFLCRFLSGDWPWRILARAYAKGASAAEKREKAQKLLAVGDDANEKDIISAHKRLLASVHPDRGGTNAQVHAANEARDLLLQDYREKTK